MTTTYPQSNIAVHNYGGVSEIEIVEQNAVIIILQRDVEGNVITNEIPTKNFHIMSK